MEHALGTDRSCETHPRRSESLERPDTPKNYGLERPVPMGDAPDDEGLISVDLASTYPGRDRLDSSYPDAGECRDPLRDLWTGADDIHLCGQRGPWFAPRAAREQQKGTGQQTASPAADDTTRVRHNPVLHHAVGRRRPRRGPASTKK